MKRLFFASFICLLFGACTKNKAGSEAPLSQEDLVKRGESIYVLSCIACHNADPAKVGSIGPAVKGSSQELLTARIMKATYPEGYKPQRSTSQMIALPHLEKEIPALTAFLNSK